jgi:hypothetical protein
MIWKESHGSKLFDGSYMSQSPSTWANQRLGLATVTHLANHINTSLTKIKHCRFWRGKPSDTSSSEDDEFMSDLNLFGGDLGDYNQHYGEDELDCLHATGDEMDLFAGGGPGLAELHR